MNNKRYLTHEQVQQEELSLLIVFSDFCKEHQLRYSLQAGTLLGAVRHRGFIPWDDDIDVSMPRPDYDRLIALSSELPRGFSLITPDNSPFAFPFVKFINTSIRAQEAVSDGVLEEYLWIDVFPIDGACNNNGEVAYIQKKLNRLMTLSSWAAYGSSPRDNIPKKFVKTIAKPICRKLGAKRRMMRMAAKIARTPSYQDSARVSSFFGGAKTGWTLPKEDYEAMIEVEFAGYMFPAMGCWDEYLTKCYGDYMKPPSSEQQATHAFKAWRLQ